MTDPDYDLMTAREVCAFFGGAGSPINISTLYRGIKNGRYPKSIRVSERAVRWRRSDCQKALDTMRRLEG